MKITNLKLTNFRNHTKLSLDLDSNLTLITGPNGSGKSNILEAIHILSTGKSSRSKYDKDLIQYNKSFCTISAKIQTNDESFDLELQIIGSEKGGNVSLKKAKINKVAKSMLYFTGIFNSVLFSPEDIQLLTGSPSERRRYIDDMISQVDKNYKRALSDYTKAVRRRNKLLESINNNQGGLDQIDFYTNQILINGTLIQEKGNGCLKTSSPILTRMEKDLEEKEPDWNLDTRKTK